MKIQLDAPIAQPSSEIFDLFRQTHQLQAGDDGLWYYHRGPVRLPVRWDDVKKHSATLFLKDYGEFRARFVNTLLAEVAQAVKCTRRCHAMAVGSNNLTSDYDVTVNGPEASKIVEMFNDRFRNAWGYDSGIIFDTNIYGTSFLQANPRHNFDWFVREDKVGKSTLMTPNDFVYYINLGNDPTDIRTQRIWALIKLVIYTLETRVFDPKIQAIMADVQEFRTDLVEAKQKLRQLTKTLRRPEGVQPGHAMIQRHMSTGSTVFEAIIEARRHEKTPSLTELNLEYEKQLQEVARIRRKFVEADDENDVVDLGRRLKNQISLTNFYGNETYFTQGAFNHVVGKLQSGYERLRVLPHEYLDSFIENFGEVVKEYALYERDPDPRHFILEASKYLMRVADAGMNLASEYHLFGNGSDGKQMLQFFKQLLAASTGIRGMKSKAKESMSEDARKKIYNVFYARLNLPHDPSLNDISSALVRQLFAPVLIAAYTNRSPFV